LRSTDKFLLEEASAVISPKYPSSKTSVMSAFTMFTNQHPSPEMLSRM